MRITGVLMPCSWSFRARLSDAPEVRFSKIDESEGHLRKCRDDALHLALLGRMRSASFPSVTENANREMLHRD
jgi:hypothetical protein